MCPMQRGCATVPAAQGLIRGEGFSLPGHGSPCVLAGRAWEYPLSRSEAISRVLLRCEVTQQFAAKQALAAKAADAAARHAAQHMLGMQAALQTALRERDQARAAASNVQAQVSRRAIAPDVDAAGPFDCTALAVLVSEAKLEKLPEQTALRHIDNGEDSLFRRMHPRHRRAQFAARHARCERRSCEAMWPRWLGAAGTPKASVPRTAA